MKHNSIVPLRSIPPIRRTFSAISIVLSLVFALAAFGVQQGTSWTYQGQLRRSGAAYTGTCNFQFTLWNAVSAGSQQGGTVAVSSVNVANGLFTVVLDFGDQFFGDSRWLGTSVQCSGDGGFTQLDPRQPITAAPYALSLRPGARIEASIDNPLLPILSVSNFSGGQFGIGIKASGQTALYGLTASSDGIGVYGQGGGADSVGVFGKNDSGTAIYGESTSGAGVWGLTTGAGPAIYGQSPSGNGNAGEFLGRVVVASPNDEGAAIRGTAHIGMRGVSDSPDGEGVWGSAQGTNSAGVLGTNSSGDGIRGTGPTGVRGVSNGNTGTIGVKGEATGTNSIGVYGSVSGSNTAAVLGVNSVSPAIWGQSTGAGPAIYGQALSSGRAGEFAGSVNVQGTLTKSAGSFRIDHPLDPANKFLSQSFVESPDMKNIYEGNVTTDARGSATVTLPAYFEALNRDYHYQLTVLGQFAQAIVSREISGNSFEIHTDKPGVKVSWLVTGIRQDAYAQEHPIVVEEFKPAEEKGLYLYPAGFGAGEEKRIGHLKRPVSVPGAQDPSGAGPSDPASK